MGRAGRRERSCAGFRVHRSTPGLAMFKASRGNAGTVRPVAQEGELRRKLLLGRHASWLEGLAESCEGDMSEQPKECEVHVLAIYHVTSHVLVIVHVKCMY